MDKHLLDILCCPTTHVPLRLLSEGELAALNRAIASGPVRNGAGHAVAGTLTTGLITRDRHTIYRIEDDIPVMLADEAIATGQLGDFPDR
ncbi:MAG: Trm112 family protein [Dokdonella sp.]|uniref:Trm112 family protein n=1 Tax=Dokdonella sp. TaxID=2291710 RepID=UPI003F7FB1FF